MCIRDRSVVASVIVIDAGDTYAYDEELLKTQKAREDAAKERIYSLLPEDQKKALIDLFDEFIGGFLNLLLTVFEIILGEIAVLLHLLEFFNGITAHVTYLDLAVLRDMGDILCDLLTLILGESCLLYTSPSPRDRG